MTRQEANVGIVEQLLLLVEKHPNWTFHQILKDTGLLQVDYSLDNKIYRMDEPYPCILDDFYEESEDSLERILNHQND